MKRAAYLLLALAGCATAPSPPPLQAAWPQQLAAAVSGPCAAYVLASPEDRVTPSVGGLSGVETYIISDDPDDPLCVAWLEGEGAGAAGRAAAEALIASGAGFALVQNGQPPPTETAFALIQEANALRVEVDLTPREGMDTAALLVSRAWSPPLDPFAPSPEEEAAAAAMTLPEAFVAALLEVAPGFLIDVEYEAAERRVRMLGAGDPGGVFVMRMSTDRRFVGLEALTIDTVQVIAMGEEAQAASDAALGRLRADGWSFAGFETTDGGVSLRCFSSPEGQWRSCVSEAVRVEAQTVAVARLTFIEG